MPADPETSSAAPPQARATDHDAPLAGGESDLDLWGGWPDDELAPPTLVPVASPPRLTDAQGGVVCDA
jgi:hypothetical protein